MYVLFTHYLDLKWLPITICNKLHLPGMRGVWKIKKKSFQFDKFNAYVSFLVGVIGSNLGPNCN